MEGLEDFARKYKEALRDAAKKDCCEWQKGKLKTTEDWQKSHLLRAIRDVACRIDSLKYTATNEFITERDRGELIDLIAWNIGCEARLLGRLLRENLPHEYSGWLRESLGALMTMCQQIEALFAALRK